MKKLSNIKIISLNNFSERAFTGVKLPFKVSYAIDENIERLEKETKKIWKAIEKMQSTELKAALEKSASIHTEQLKTDEYKDTDGTASERAAFLTLKPTAALIKEFDEFVENRAAALEEEVEFDFYSIPRALVENLEFTSWQMKLLKYMLADKGKE